ncbi:MAG: galactose oxidase [Candidatus Eremiobacteraeota bacterium]|nr:galactose oxidase [Candidatus Eremiobacteraeota bacterium]
MKSTAAASRALFVAVAALPLLFGNVVAAPSTGTWALGPPLPTERSEDTVAAWGTKIYVIAGYVPAGPHPALLEASARADVDGALVQEFDVPTGRWTERAPLPRGMNHVAGIGVSGKIYAFGGFVGQNRDPVSDAYAYDTSTDRWTAIAPLPEPLGSIAVAELDGKIHLVGGRDVHSVGTHHVYDPQTNRYTSAAPLPIGRDHMGLVASGGKLYAVAGRIDDFNHNTSYCDVYEPASDRWTSCTAMPSTRSGMAVALYRERIFAIGGEYGGGTFTNDEAYDPRTNTWSTFAPLPEGRHGTGAAVVNGRLYVPAGAPTNGGSRQSSTLYIFTVP